MEKVKDKWWYINEISRKSSRYGDKLLELMAWAGVNNLLSVTYEQAKEFYETRM